MSAAVRHVDTRAPVDSFSRYLDEIARYPLLTRDQEAELSRRIQAGDRDAVHELVCANLRFVVAIAKRYRHQGVAMADLVNEGNIGLLRAAERYDHVRGVKFISYAVWWIRQAILSSLARQGRTVRVPLNRTADLSRIIKASEILRQKLRREPSPEELAQVREKCPIERLKRELLAQGIKADELESISERARQEVQHAVEAARAAPRPDPATVLADVYRSAVLEAIPG